MASARSATIVDLPPARAYELWTDVSRWPTFVDGFGHVDRIDERWPQSGAKVVWRSVPTGRGIVTERVQDAEAPTTFATQVLEEKLIGTQTAEFAPAPDDDSATALTLTLDYKLQSRNPLSHLVDLVFIRRAQNDALARTLKRFATEAAEEAAL